jgi:hypothetical protein
VHNLLVGPVVVGVLLEEEKGEQGDPSGPQPQVVRSVTRRWSKASPSVYRSYRMINMTCFTYLCRCCLCTKYTVLYDDDRLHASTLPYVILVVEVFMFID